MLLQLKNLVSIVGVKIAPADYVARTHLDTALFSNPKIIVVKGRWLLADSHDSI